MSVNKFLINTKRGRGSLPKGARGGGGCRPRPTGAPGRGRLPNRGLLLLALVSFPRIKVFTDNIPTTQMIMALSTAKQASYRKVMRHNYEWVISAGEWGPFLPTANGDNSFRSSTRSNNKPSGNLSVAKLGVGSFWGERGQFLPKKNSKLFRTQNTFDNQPSGKY